MTPGARILTFEYDTDGFWPVNAETPLEGISDDLFEELISQRFETETVMLMLLVSWSPLSAKRRQRVP